MVEELTSLFEATEEVRQTRLKLLDPCLVLEVRNDQNLWMVPGEVTQIGAPSRG
jgi:hypothetical protein